MLRDQGKKRPHDDVRATASGGWLWVSNKAPNGMPVPNARLYGADGMVVARIEPVRDVLIRNGGVLIQGFEWEVSWSGKRLRQSWWCVPEPPPGGLVWPPVPPFSF